MKGELASYQRTFNESLIRDLTKELLLNGDLGPYPRTFIENELGRYQRTLNERRIGT